MKKIELLRNTLLILFLTIVSSRPTVAAPANTLTTTSKNISLTQLPFFENSSMAGLHLTLTADYKLMSFSEIGIRTLDLSAAEPRWERFYNYEGYQGQNFTPGVGSMVVDPANPDVAYFCSGDNNAEEKDTIPYYTYLDMGGLFRSTDGLESAQQITGNSLTEETGDNPGWERYMLGCPSKAYNRYFVEEDSGVERWFLWNHSDLFAFDDRETVTLSSSSAIASKSFYFMTYHMGLYRATYDESGKELTWENVHKEPIINDDASTTGTSLAAIGLTQDIAKYQYDDSADYGTVVGEIPPLYSYDPESGTDCDYESSGVTYYGDYDSITAKCVEDEIHGIGATVMIDPVYQAYNKSIGETKNAVLYAGYLTQKPYWRHGGLFRGVADDDGKFSWQEILNPDTGESLDVRAIDCDEEATVTVSGEKMAKYCYVASGGDGVFKITADTSGTATAESINSGITTRADYHKTCISAGTCDDKSYIYTDIDQDYVDGKSYLQLGTQTAWQTYYAIDDFSGSLTWKTINYRHEDAEVVNTNLRAGSVQIDAIGKRLFIGTGPVMSIEIADLTNAPETVDSNNDGPSGLWTIWEDGFGDYTGPVLIDPLKPDTRVHLAGLDITYGSVERGDNYEQELEYIRPEELGFCYGMYYTDDNTNMYRQNSYGRKILTGKSKITGENILYSAADAPDNVSDGAITRGKWDAAEVNRYGTTGDWRWELATGDKSCSTYDFNTDYTQPTGCYYKCDRKDSTDALPMMSMSQLAVDPQDGEHLALIGYDSTDSKYHLYDSKNAGDDWTSRDDVYVYGAAKSGYSLNLLGAVQNIIFDPQDSNVLYVVFTGGSGVRTYGVFKLDLVNGYATDITNLDSSSENKENATTLAPYDSSKKTYNTLGVTKSMVVKIYDLQAGIDAVTGKTRLYLAAYPYCDSGWEYFPETFCTDAGFINGGGVYSRLIDTDATKDATIYWDKLNASSADYDFFMAYAIALSPADPNVIVVGGYNGFSWKDQGNPQGLSAGLIYTQDGGKTWQAATTVPINVMAVAAHPTDQNKFTFSIQSSGVWALDLNDPDTDGDGIRDTKDNCDSVSNPTQENTDSDTWGNACDNCVLLPNELQRDADSDGIGNVCDDSDGDGVSDETDCQPTNPAVSPATSELCTTPYDDNCNGMINENDALDAKTFYRDDDSDGFGLTSDSLKACLIPPYHYATKNGDCDDTNVFIHPTQAEVCDGIDNNCDGITDEPSRFSLYNYYRDFDRDGQGDPRYSKKACSSLKGYSTLNSDCLDSNPTVYRGAPEICDDGLDNDCDKRIDEGCKMKTFPREKK